MVPDNVREAGVPSGGTAEWSATGLPMIGLESGLALMRFMAGRCDSAMLLSRGAPDVEAALSSGRLRLRASALDRWRRRRRGVGLHGPAALLDRLGSRGLGGRELHGAIGLRVQEGDDI